MFLDAKGKACPMPVLLAIKALDGGCDDLTVEVDNSTAVQNLSRMAANRGLTVTAEEGEGTYRVHMTGTPAAAPAEEAPCEAAQPVSGGFAVFVSKDRLGEGDQTLGRNLLRMALYTLSQGEKIPDAVLLMNGGVKVAAGDDDEIVKSLRALIARGTEVLVCGTCLNFYGLTGSLQVGTVSNMYDILERMTRAPKVIML